MRWKTKNNKGFSLIELMVVVAIIGILATIAVPQVNRFMAKARQSEAKGNLSAMYTSQKTFFAEYNTYFAGFNQIGFAPEGQLRYNLGFQSLHDVSAANVRTYGYNAPIPSTVTTSSAWCATSPSCEMLATASPSVVGTALTNNTFIANARGIISSGTINDEWHMNENRILTNTVPGFN